MSWRRPGPMFDTHDEQNEKHVELFHVTRPYVYQMVEYVTVFHEKRIASAIEHGNQEVLIGRCSPTCPARVWFR